jgi:septal ring factor EnvC (AmiA/AmiB activator)
MPDPNGTPDKEKWEEAGFESEQAMIDAAKAATDLRSKITEAEATLKKERDAKSKTDSDYMRQAQEIGDLRKKLKETEKTPNASPDKDEKQDDVLESLSQEEVAVLDGVLNDPKNAELKKRVALGGTTAMAEFVQAYRTESPVDLTVSLFGALRKKKSDMVPAASIAKAVKDLFAQHSNDEKQSLAATPQGGTPPDRMAKAKKQMVVGGVGVEFFKKDQQ